MKYGLITFKKSRNIGDDIQSYAAIKFLPKVDYYIEREQINEFVSKNDEPVTIIFNGWFNHDKYSFPPSPFINPLFISAHFTDGLTDEKPIYFTDYFLKYLKNYEPIGLRDSLTKSYLDDANIQNYFSGCLTLTIQPFEDIKPKNRICVVDIDEELVEMLQENSNMEICKKTHTLSKEHETLSWEERMNKVEDLLKFYQASKLVVTSRLHCALPCLALGIPVILIYDGENKDVKNRLGEYAQLLNCVSKEEAFETLKNYIKKIPSNPVLYQKYRNQLIEKVETFIASSKEKVLANENAEHYQKYFVDQKHQLMEIIQIEKKHLNELAELRYTLLKQHEHEIEKLKMIIEGLKAERNFALEQTKILYNNFDSLSSKYYKIQQIKKRHPICYKIFKAMIKVFRKIKTIGRKLLKRG